MPETVNIYDLLKSGEAFLKSKNLPDAKSDAQYLLAAALKIERSRLVLIREQKAGEKESSLFWEYILRRSKREPAAYITGFCGFMGLEFKVSKDVLIPRPETELLVEDVLNMSKKNKTETVLDLCAGSGCIAVSLSKLGNFNKIYASDISFDALTLARENADFNDAKNIEFLLSDMFKSLENVKVDFIVSNPPYISEDEYNALEPELKFEPETALLAQDNGLFFYKEIALKASRHLNDKGRIFVELNANLSQEIKKIFEENNFKDIEINEDYSHLPRVLKAHL
ncbi:MAG: peptide chain release factor N(5)-glutamine methyltransferase [Endomicrobium sp.]|jgi:release factor glutamine methyltransferase|nr:peptide chain release factor N(5)-glutamine methyltransferase [Endomicrobium sp.]